MIISSLCSLSRPMQDVNNKETWSYVQKIFTFVLFFCKPETSLIKKPVNFFKSYNYKNVMAYKNVLSFLNKSFDLPSIYSSETNSFVVYITLLSCLFMNYWCYNIYFFVITFKVLCMQYPKYSRFNFTLWFFIKLNKLSCQK